MPAVNSSAISFIDYNYKTNELYVTFRKSGDTYTYYDVPEEEYRRFLNAGSVGRYFNQRISDIYSTKWRSPKKQLLYLSLFGTANTQY